MYSSSVLDLIVCHQRVTVCVSAFFYDSGGLFCVCGFFLRVSFISYLLRAAGLRFLKIIHAQL